MSTITRRASRQHSSFHLRPDEVERQEPNFFVKWIVFHPVKIYCACFFLTIVCFVLVGMGIQIQLEDGRDWLIQSGDEVDLSDARRKAIDFVTAGSVKPVQSQDNFGAMIGIYFRSSSSNVLTPSNVDKIIEVTHAISNDTKYKNEYCFWDLSFPDSDCAPDAIDTIIYEFDGLNQQEINAKLDTLPSEKYYYFGENIATSEKRSNLFVSYLKVGLPFPSCSKCNTSDYDSDVDRYDEQIEPYVEWMTTIWDDYKEEGSDFEIFPMSYESYGTLLNEALGTTTALLSICILIIFSYVTFHTQSFFLGSMGMLQILICFAPAFVVYWYIMNIKFFGVMNSTIVFVILGIGADDMFVMTDAWVQSAHLYESNLERMSYAFNRAAKAMLITSFTTACSFFATTISPILPIKTFGVWAGLVILFNYLYFITMYPTLIMMQHYCKDIRCCFCGRCCPCQCCKEEELESQELDTNMEYGGEDLASNQQLDQDLQKEYRWAEHFFKDRFSNVIVDGKYLILAVFAVIAGVGIYASTTLQPPQSAEDFVRPGSKYAEYFQIMSEDVYSDPQYQNIEVVTFWGVKDIDRSNYGTWQSGGGDIVWDDIFDLRSSEAQQHIYDFCIAIAEDETLVADQEGSLSCFMIDFKDYIGSGWPKNYDTEQDLVNDLQTFMESPEGEYYALVNVIGIKDNILRYIEISARSTVSDLTSSSRDKKDNLNAYKAFLKEWNAKDVAGVNNGKVTSANYEWAWTETEPFFAKGAVNGIAIVVPLAFLVLLIFTRNVIISFFAMVSIFGVMLSVCILVLIAGWDFGIIESIAVIIVIGFSIDYVVHLGHAFLESTLEDREKRLTMAILTMGISVSSGAFTTALSGIPLMFSVLVFFYKMGLLIFCVCMLALSWSLFFFMALLAAFGPEGDVGNIQSSCCGDSDGDEYDMEKQHDKL